MMRIAFIVVVLVLLLGLGYFIARKTLRPPSVKGREVYAEKPNGPSIDHTAFNSLLKHYVKDGMVDYAGLKKDESQLQRYLDQISTLDPQPYDRDELLALFINAYNATTLKLIVEHYPGIQSIRDIPSAKRWHDRRWSVAGETLSIDEIENKVLRARFREPRIHFSIVCASIGCPPLRSEAYRGKDINQQLDSQARLFNQSDQFVKLQGNTLWLSSIYDWYSADFKSVAGTVLEFVARYAQTDVKEAIAKRGNDLQMKYLNYDWNLNEQKPQ
ncbi:MAG TPA: DUF547 domain-containing protein [Acidobacteriota bacterium]|jgi:hypothetical protein|nr:DUF547 domain-containing protein [Acidobacteriota bacterium]